MAKKVFTEQDVITIIDQESKSLNLRVFVEELPWAFYAIYGSACIGFANPLDQTIHLFIDSLMTLIGDLDRYTAKLGKLAKISDWYRRPEKVLRKHIRGLIIHEARHVEQYRFLAEKGIDVAAYMQEKNKSSYWLRRHELDAYLVQYTGIRLPLKWVLGV